MNERALALVAALGAAGLAWWWFSGSAGGAGAAADPGAADAGTGASAGLGLPSFDFSPVSGAFADLFGGSGGGLDLSAGSAAMNQVSSSQYSSNPNYLAWASTIQSAADQYGVPSDLLANLLYEESHYRSDIISGATVSRTGAQGIAQFEPATAQSLGVDPLDPSSAIPGAAQLLAQLYRQFGTWPLAVAAYNWGSGNVSKWLSNGSTGKVPSETVAYVGAITGQALA